MEIFQLENRGCVVSADGSQQLHPSLLKSQAFLGKMPTYVDDVIITSEFQRRKTKALHPALELAALKHLTNFLTAEPMIVLNELATVLVQVCDAGSAGITLEERRHATETLQCVGAAGLLSSEKLEWVPRHSPSGMVIDTQKVEIFRRPERFFLTLRKELLPLEELLVVPWQLSSGRKGAIWVALHDRDRHLNPEDLRLVSILADFARQALQRSHSDETRRSCETLASATRVANQLAHEVNNPLQALINSLYLISPATENEYVLEARLQADRLVDLVRSVLEVKRQESVA